MLLSSLQEHYTSRMLFKKEMSAKGFELDLYDIHDGKMLHNLTQHSQWNRKYHPFLLCKCKKGQAIKNPTFHKCNLISDDEYSALCNKSASKFLQAYTNEYNAVNVEKHRDWADKDNFGVTHFGINPSLLPLSSIGFDNMHTRFSNVRSIWTYVRDYVESYGYNLQNKFSTLLKLQIGEYYIDCHDTGKSLAVMHGEQIDSFLDLIPKIADFLKVNFEPTEQLNNILHLLQYYPPIDSFLRISQVIDTNLSSENQMKQIKQYEEDFKVFKSNLLCYQKAASETFLTRQFQGDRETFCSHVLFCYYPQMIQRIWDKHKMGIGIFTLQGFERRNKESKTAAKRFYNGRHNVCCQIINRVFDSFYYSE